MVWSWNLRIVVEQSNKKENKIDENGFQYVHTVAKKVPLTK
jgi:hypothetical protein